MLSISFKEFLDLLHLAFNKPPNVTLERYKLQNRKQREREPFEHFWGALTDLASTCSFRKSDEAEWIRDVFISNMRNSESIINPSESLSQALMDEKGFFNHQKLTNTAKLINGLSFKSFHGNNHVRKEPNMNTERSNLCKK